MGFTYFQGNNWKDVSREERLFCSHLYHKINQQGNTKKFVEWLNNTKSPLTGFENQLSLDVNVEWEIAYETCFYRDILKSYGHGVKEKLVQLSLNKNIGGDSVNLIKRTFDLTLFSEDTIVIIEAKAAQGLSTKQFKEFEVDEKLIKGVFEELKIKKAPRIIFIILASQSYFSSPAFTLQNGIGKLNLIDKQKVDRASSSPQNTGSCKINALFSWQQLIDSELFNDQIFERAEKSYKLKG